MGKLIELLNERMKEEEKIWPKHSRFLNYDGINHVFRLNNGCSFCMEFVLSKRYWFIKWLVENDKIDISKANDKNLNGYEIELRIRAVKELVADSEEKTVLYLNLLMLLSISNSPIDDLISYLR